MASLWNVSLSAGTLASSRVWASQWGDTAFQTYFEVLAFIMAVERWCDGSSVTAVFGDNVGALQEALELRGKGSLLELAQLLAILRGARTLDIEVAHLPTEANDIADALSRQAGPIKDRKPWPFSPQQSVRVVVPIDMADLWAWLSPPGSGARSQPEDLGTRATDLGGPVAGGAAGEGLVF